MSLTGAFQIGSTALNAAQLAIQVTGNNLANAATPGYSRQVARLSPLRGDGSIPGLTIGHGVGISEVRRQIDQALQGRLWGGVSDEASARQRLGVLSQIESSLNELTGQDLSSELGAFFNAWSEATNAPGAEASVVQQGDKLASFIRRMRADLVSQRSQIDRTLGDAVVAANAILSDIAGLNRQVVSTEAGGAHANALRDQRDALVSELSKYADVSVEEQSSGAVNVLIGSTPVVLGSTARGLALTSRNTAGGAQVAVTTQADGQTLGVDSGQIGALLAERRGSVDRTVAQLDSVASQLIFQTNRIHSTGSNAGGLTGATANLAVPAADRARAINDPANGAFAGLPFAIGNGGFSIVVRNAVSGAEKTYRVDVDLDGIDDAGQAGTGDDTSVEDIRAALNAVPGVSASFTPEGKLRIAADAGFSFSFADDSASALAVLGVNAYFQGSTARDIQVREDLAADPTLLQTGRTRNGSFVQNATALDVANLQDSAIQALGGRTLSNAWLGTVQEVGLKTSAADAASKASSLVRESLEAQRASVSGVSMDEEAVNLLNFQQTYQGAARFISVVNDMTQILLSLV